MKNVGLSDLQKDSMHAWKAKKGEHKSRFSILIQNTLVMDGDGLQRNKEVETFFLVVGTQTYTSTTVFKIMIFFCTYPPTSCDDVLLFSYLVAWIQASFLSSQRGEGWGTVESKLWLVSVIYTISGFKLQVFSSPTMEIPRLRFDLRHSVS